MRRLLLFSIFLIVGVNSIPARPDDITSKFFGAWRLVSVEGNPVGRPFSFDRPSGLLIYDPSGRMSVQIVAKVNRKPLAPYAHGAPTATAEEKAAAFDSYIAYFGTYTVHADERKIIHHIEDSINPGRHGTDNIRWFEFQSKDRLLLIPVENNIDRKHATYKLLWEKIK